MELSNFNFLQSVQSTLFEYGRSAERYAHSDPQSAIFKVRCFAEQFVGYIYQELRLPTYGAKDLFEKIDNAAFVRSVEQCVLEKLHLIRMKGNKAVHAGKASKEDALDLIREAFLLGTWIYMAYHGGAEKNLPIYRVPQGEDAKIGADTHETEERAVESEQLLRAQEELLELQQRLNEAQKRIEELDIEIDESKLKVLKEGSEKALALYDFGIEDTREKIRIEDIFAQYDLTDGQTELVLSLDKFLFSSCENVFLLKGYAGTGKTFITKGLTEYFRAIRRNYILAAPTGKAAKVIASKTKSQAYTIHKTIYSFKDIAEYREDDLDGSETYKFYAQLAVNEQSVDTVYIIDESSMISDIYNEAEFFRFGSGHLLRDFLKFVNLDHNDHRKKVIFIGDNAQLPPVGMRFSPALDPKYLSKEYGLRSTGYELSEVVRQKSGSGVMINAEMLRGALEAGIFNQLDIDLNSPDVNHVEYEDLLTDYLRACGDKINAEAIVIAHSNADVASYNRRIREHFFPNISEIAAGDKVMAVSNSNAYGLFISNGDFGLVRGVLGEPEQRQITLKRKSKETDEVETIKIPLSFREVEVGFRDLDGSAHWFQAKIIDNLLNSDEPNLSSDENKALYLDFCIRHPSPQLKRKSLEFKEKLQRDPYFNALRLKYGYAVTCHKAQGSEWNNVFVKCKTHQQQLSAEYFRWLYTAITRTTKNLYLLDEPHRKLLGPIPSSESPGEINRVLASGELDNKTVSSRVEEAPNVPAIDSRDQQLVPEDAFLSGNEFLDALLAEVRSRLVSSGIDIRDIQHNQFHESYFFVRGPDTERINIFYKKDKRIASVVLPRYSDLGGELLELLSPLKGISPKADNSNFEKDEYVSGEEFLDALHQQLLKVSRENGITVADVREQQWFQRYKFVDENGIAVVDIYYNKKKQFNSCNPVKSLCTSKELTGRVMRLITDGLA